MQTSTDYSDAMKIPEVAAYLRISTRTLYDLAKAGKVPCARVGSQWRFDRRELDNFLRGGGNSSGQAVSTA